MKGSSLTFFVFPCTWQSLSRTSFSIPPPCYSYFGVALSYWWCSHKVSFSPGTHVWLSNSRNLFYIGLSCPWVGGHLFYSLFVSLPLSLRSQLLAKSLSLSFHCTNIISVSPPQWLHHLFFVVELLSLSLFHNASLAFSHCCFFIILWASPSVQHCFFVTISSSAVFCHDFIIPP